MILHTLNKPSSLASCLRLAEQSSAILFLEDAVICALGLDEQILQQHSVYALEEDLQARGLIHKIKPGVTPISYAQFVGLSLEYSKVQAW